MDGVLVDTEPLHEQALQAVLAERGVALSSEEYAALLGLTDEATFRWVVSHFSLPDKLVPLIREYEDVLMPALGVAVVPASGALELVTMLCEQRIPLALASSSSGRAVEAVLAGVGLTGAFSAIVCGGDVREGKPDPAIFIMAADRLSLAAHACVVIEDSPNGMAAGRLAGMTVVGVRTRYTKGLALSADLLVNSLGELVG